MKFKQIEVSEIQADENIRSKVTKESIEGLVSSIKQQGILQPLLVREKNNKFDLIAGFRRLAAARELGLKEVPCVIEEVEDDERTQVQLIENIQREDLNPIDEAKAISELLKSRQKNDVALWIGKTERYIDRRIVLLSLPSEIKKAIVDKVISAGHGVVLSRLTQKKAQLELFRSIVSDRFSVKQAESNLDTYAKRLDMAPFDRKDCKTCQYAGGNIKDLFDEEVSLKGSCLNPPCFEKKLKAYVADRIRYWKEEGIEVLSPEAHNRDYNKWHSVSEWAIEEIGRDNLTEALREKKENFAVVFAENGAQQMLVKESFFKNLIRRSKLSNKAKAGGQKADELLLKERRKTKQLNRVDDTKRRFLIAKLSEKASADQLYRIALDMLFFTESGQATTIGKFLKLKTARPNFEVRCNLISKFKDSKPEDIRLEIQRIARDYIGDYSTKQIEDLASEVGLHIGQFRIDKEYLEKLTKEEILKLLKEFSLKAPDKFDSKKKEEMVDWILKQGLKEAPKELVK